jgi:hypothetical protein
MGIWTTGCIFQIVLSHVGTDSGLRVFVLICYSTCRVSEIETRNGSTVPPYHVCAEVGLREAIELYRTLRSFRGACHANSAWLSRFKATTWKGGRFGRHCFIRMTRSTNRQFQFAWNEFEAGVRVRVRVLGRSYVTIQLSPIAS